MQEQCQINPKSKLEIKIYKNISSAKQKRIAKYINNPIH